MVVGPLQYLQLKYQESVQWLSNWDGQELCWQNFYVLQSLCDTVLDTEKSF